ncbi:MAG TPA: hypothetical protein PK830_01840 [Candidatus Atribacteria bacterium]|nr:hypothetical protein [Candidatus Atribacteria bacterium]HPT77833.1 hypothetical protein [Candidatus Atribacteria bacterium]
MSKFTVNKTLFEGLAQYFDEKNSISPFALQPDKNLSSEEIDYLKETGILGNDGSIVRSLHDMLTVVAKPAAAVNLLLTGGAGLYKHSLYYDATYTKCIYATYMTDDIVVTDEESPDSLMDTIAKFIGKSNLKSLDFNHDFDIEEALVIAAIIDLERKLCLRALIDEIPYDQNLYGYNKIWRTINSTSSSIQWFVHIINQVIGEYTNLSYKQVQDALERLVPLGLLSQKNGLYQLSDELVFLANRMLINDNIVSVSALKQWGNGIISSGFTSVQAGIHDILYLDYNGDTIKFKTMSSDELLESIDFFINNKEYFSKLTA